MLGLLLLVAPCPSAPVAVLPSAPGRDSVCEACSRGGRAATSCSNCARSLWMLSALPSMMTAPPRPHAEPQARRANSRTPKRGGCAACRALRCPCCTAEGAWLEPALLAWCCPAAAAPMARAPGTRGATQPLSGAARLCAPLVVRNAPFAPLLLSLRRGEGLKDRAAAWRAALHAFALIVWPTAQSRTAGHRELTSTAAQWWMSRCVMQRWTAPRSADSQRQPPPPTAPPPGERTHAR